VGDSHAELILWGPVQAAGVSRPEEGEGMLARSGVMAVMSDGTVRLFWCPAATMQYHSAR
jgi:hypothetical protein